MSQGRQENVLLTKSLKPPSHPLIRPSLFHIDILGSPAEPPLLLRPIASLFSRPPLPSVCPHPNIDRVFMGSVINVTSSLSFIICFLLFCHLVLLLPHLTLLLSPSTPLTHSSLSSHPLIFPSLPCIHLLSVFFCPKHLLFSA